MPIGEGKYAEACHQARLATKASTVLLMVMDGDKGNGFSVESDDPMFALRLPEVLTAMATAMENDLSKVKETTKENGQL